ncbi:hypothetical protein [Thalassospira profundimaris]|uniref:hypothetical protein n=1 Tax=Thalassospira profundimaris TaxID=502049 RepID=UPI0011BD5512|nr:hypothetical protein [Thalassospira profundimaris]
MFLSRRPSYVACMTVGGLQSREAHKFVDYVYDRAVGEVRQEVGGIMTTLATLCLVVKVDMLKAGQDELEGCSDRIDQFRAKEANKPKLLLIDLKLRSYQAEPVLMVLFGIIAIFLRGIHHQAVALLF